MSIIVMLMLLLCIQYYAFMHGLIAGGVEIWGRGETDKCIGWLDGWMDGWMDLSWKEGTEACLLACVVT